MISCTLSAHDDTGEGEDSDDFAALHDGLTELMEILISFFDF